MFTIDGLFGIQLFDPLQPEEFIANHFKKGKLLHLPRNNKDFEDLLRFEDVLEILMTMGSSSTGKGKDDFDIQQHGSEWKLIKRTANNGEYWTATFKNEV